MVELLWRMAKNRVRVQHFVPQFYLRRFAVPGFTDRKKASIWVMNAETGEVYTKKVRNIAAEDYLYSHKQPDGTRCFEIENQLSELENLIARFYDRFVNGVPDLSQSWGMKKFLSLFLATLMIRHPDDEEKNRQLHANMVELFEQVPKDSNGIPFINSFIHKGKEYPFDPSGYHEYKAADENRLKEAFAQQILPVAQSLVDDLFSKRWVIFCTDQPAFFTSDRPVKKLHTERHNFGTRTPGTQIIFPISPKRMLWMMDREGDAPDGFYPLPMREASGLNVLSMSNATRYVLSHEQPDGMFAGVRKIIDEEWKRLAGAQA
jgi:hypothetical protein